MAVRRKDVDPAVFNQFKRVAGGFTPAEIAGVELNGHVHVHQGLDIIVVGVAAVPLDMSDNYLDAPQIFDLLDTAEGPFAPGLKGHFEEQVTGLAEAELFEVGVVDQSVPVRDFSAKGKGRQLQRVRSDLLALLAQRLDPAVHRFQQSGRCLFPAFQKVIDGFLGVIVGRRHDASAPLTVVLGQQGEGFLRRLAAVVHSWQEVAVEIVKGKGVV